jgi:hypothetical protein
MAKLIALTLLLLGVYATNPGLTAGINLAAIETAKDQILPTVISNIGNVGIPNQSGSVGHGFFELKIDMDDIVLSGMNLNTGASTLTTSPPHVLNVNIIGITGEVHMNFSYHSKLLSSGGHASAGISDTNAHVGLEITESGGKPVVNITGVNVSIGNLSVHLSGNVLDDVANWIVNMIKGDLKGDIENAIGKAITGSAQDALAKFLDKLPLVIDIGGTRLGVNYELPSDPVFGSNYFEVASVGMMVI